MIHLEIVGSNPSPRGLSRLGSYVDGSKPARIGSPSVYPTSRGSARLIRIPSDRLPSRSTRRALQRSSPHEHVPLPEPADVLADDPLPAYIATVSNAISSYNPTPTSSGRSSPINADTQSTLSQGGWTTGNTTERSSLDSSCYSLDEFDRQAASTVNRHFEEFESLLYEGARDTVSSVHRECQEWSAQFPHLRVLGKQVVAPKDSGYYFVSPSSSENLTPRPSTSGTLDLNIADHDLSFSSDSQGLTLSGRRVKASKPPTEASSTSALNHEYPHSSSSNEYDFLHEEIFAQDGIYEDIIAVDYKNIYEDNMEHKKQITPRRRRVGYPPITPNACVKDSVSSGAFDTMWHEIMSWLRLLLRKYASEVVDTKKEDEADYALGHPLAPTPPFRTSSFVMASRPISTQGNPWDPNMSFDGMLNVSKVPLRNRNSEQPESPILMHSPSLMQSQKTSRPSTVHPPQARGGWRARRLEPLPEPSKEEGKKRESPQGSLQVRQIMPHRLSSPPTPLSRLSTLPPLESSSTQPGNRRQGYRVSSAIDKTAAPSTRDRGNNAVEASRPSTTQAFRSETPFSGIGNRRSSTPLGQSAPGRHSGSLSLMHHVPAAGNMSLGITGSGIHPSAEHSQIPSNILEDHEGPLEDIRHNQWMPTTSNQNFLRRMRPHHLRL